MNLPSLLPRFLPWAAAVCFTFAGPNPVSANPETETAIPASIAEAPTSVEMIMIMAGEAAADGKDSLALRRYQEVIREYNDSVHAPEAHFQSSLIRIERKQWTKAFEHLQEIVDSYPDYPGFKDVIRQQHAIADALGQGARLRLFGTIPGFRSPERAVEYFEQIVENAPFSEVAPSALLRAANLQVERGQLDEAIDFYDRFISEYPNHEEAAEAYFGLAEAFSTRVRGPAYDQGANREAISYYEDFLILHPRHPRAAEAEERIQEMRDILAQSRVVIGDFYFFYRDNLTAARIFYNEAISLSPVSPSADEAREKLLRVEKRAEDIEDDETPSEEFDVSHN